MTFTSFRQTLVAAATQWSANKSPRTGAALAYYAVFSLAPFTVLAIGVAGNLFGRDAARDRVSAEVGRLVGSEGGRIVQSVVESADNAGMSPVGSAVGLAMLIFGAAALFGELHDALNTVWGVRPRSGRWAWELVGVLRSRLLSFTMVLGTAFLLLVSLVISSLLTAVAGTLGDWHLGGVALVVVGLFDLALVAAVFALIYRYLPDAKVAWRDVWLGAVVAAVLFALGKSLIGLYLGRAAIGTAFGAAGSLAVLLVWLYYAAQIFLFGAELTRAYADRMGSQVQPEPYAEPVSEAETKGVG